MSTPIQFTDVTLRDGQQSLAATRMTLSQTLRALNIIRTAGFSVLELWGGAVLDSCVRFEKKDPWERLDSFQKMLQGSSVKISALLRGQNLFAYQPYPDDLVIAFVKEAIQSGVGIFRIFDALNDWRNLQTSLLAIKAYGALAEAAVSYTTSPVHTTDYFIKYAQKLEAEGADQLAIKDMAGLLYPTEARDLIRGLKQNTHLPIALHSHTTTGVGLLNAIVGMVYGIDSIDCAITPFAGGSSHPPVEVLMVFAEELGLDHGLDKNAISAAQKELFGIFDELKSHIPYAGKYYRPVQDQDVDRNSVQHILKLVQAGNDDAIQEALTLSRDLLKGLGYPDYNDKIFVSQIPGGMITNLQQQLKEMGQPDILDRVMKEIPVVRKDVGYVPLVTPTSQIVGSQAAFNIMAGERYSFVSNEFRMLLRGEFGRTPANPNPEVVQKVLGQAEEPLKYRPASYLSPVLEEKYDLPFVKTNKDLLLHLLLGQSADEVLLSRNN